MSKMRDAVLGLAIGDALGVPYEFKDRGSFMCTDMVGHGTHDQPAGTWSDDTSMTLATLDSLKNNDGRIVPDDIRRNFNNWLRYISDLDSSQIKSSGYVVDTLEAALWAVSHKGEWEKSFRGDILAAVNLGKDTDTVGAVAGGLAGIIYGLDDVRDWVDRLRNKEEIIDCLW